jgi:hypothetical protein
MPLVAQIVCDTCHAVKKATNHWCFLHAKGSECRGPANVRRYQSPVLSRTSTNCSDGTDTAGARCMADSQRRPMACLGQSGRVLVLTFSLLLLSISTGAHLPPPPYEEAMRLGTDRALGIATVWQEARGLDYQGKVNVASAMRNRMKRNTPVMAP